MKSKSMGFLNCNHFKRNLQLSIPVIIGQLGHITVTVTDSIMIGRVSVNALAASTFASVIFHLLLFFGIGFSLAITPMVASENPNNTNKIKMYLRNALIVNTMLGLTLSALGIFSSFFLSSFGQEEEIVKLSKPYLIIVSSSTFPVLLFQTFRQFSEGLSNTLTPMIVSIIANLINVLLNYCMIYGNFGIPALGLDGAGYATLISRVLMVFLIIFLMRRHCSGIFSLKYHKKIITEIVRIGLPTGMQYIFEVSAFGLSAIMVGWISVEALAAHNIAINLSSITFMIASGFAAAASIRIGNHIRDKESKRHLRDVGLSIVAITLLFMGISGTVFILLRHSLPLLYVDDVVVIEIAAQLLIIAAIFQISDGAQAVGLGILRGFKDVKISTWVTFFSFWIVAIPVGYVIGFNYELGAVGIWIGLCLGLTIAAILHLSRFFYLLKKTEHL